MFEAWFSDGMVLYSEESYTQTARIIKWYLQSMEEPADAVLHTRDGREVAYFRNYQLERNVLKRWDILEEEER